jgi:hypothetical protein
MGEMHDLVLRVGRDEARQLVGPESRHLVDMAAAVLAEEGSQTNFMYSGFALTALPHRAIPPEKPWVLKTPVVELIVEPGTIPDGTSNAGAAGTIPIGVPFGSRARLILLYLQTQAVRTQNREVELGRSMRNWIERMDVSSGGKTYIQVREQAKRLALCRMSFFWKMADSGQHRVKACNVVDDGLLFLDNLNNEDDDRQGRLWEDRVILGQPFFDMLSNHAVPVSEAAIRALSNNSLALDVYVFLAYRLRAIKKPTIVSWSSLHAQFGAGFKLVRHFRAHFRGALKEALAVYPDAKVTDEGADGLMLMASQPPIPDREFLRLVK